MLVCWSKEVRYVEGSRHDSGEHDRAPAFNGCAAGGRDELRGLRRHARFVESGARGAETGRFRRRLFLPCIHRACEVDAYFVHRTPKSLRLTAARRPKLGSQSVHRDRVRAL